MRPTTWAVVFFLDTRGFNICNKTNSTTTTTTIISHDKISLSTWKNGNNPIPTAMGKTKHNQSKGVSSCVDFTYSSRNSLGAFRINCFWYLSQKSLKVFSIPYSPYNILKNTLLHRYLLPATEPSLLLHGFK